MNGNWMWGSFFYNVSYAVSEIDAVRLTSRNTSLVVLGQANSRPIIMTLNREDGQINKFLSLDLVDKSGNAPTYYVYQGVYLDEKDDNDGDPYIYLSFTMTSSYDIHIMRIYNPSSSGSTPKIDWHMKYMKTSNFN